MYLRKIVLVLLLLPSAAQASDWTGGYTYIDWTTDYRFYGMSSSNGQPTLQGGMHWILPAAYYVGVFASGVRFKDYRNTSYELDLYAGHHIYFDDNDLNLQLLYSAFPDASAHAFYRPGYVFPTYNFGEASVELAHKYGPLTLSSKLLTSPAYGSDRGVMLDADSAASYAVTDCLTLDARVGRQWIEKGTDRTHWEIGGTATWRWRAHTIALDFRFVGTDLNRAQCFGRNWCAPGAVAKVTDGIAL